ncbi:hypothetical protein ACFL2Q_06750 [Thermodesulfobacteriota bacterium]
MVKKLAILGFILVAVAAASMVWAGTNVGSISAPTPTVMPAAAPACPVGGCPPPPVPAKVKAKPKNLVTTIAVKMQYPQPKPLPPVVGCAGPPPIPVAVPMWKFIVPWPPFVYYLPVE